MRFAIPLALVLAGIALVPVAGHARGVERCPHSVAKLPILRAGGVLRGDVDGDGRRDTVTIRRAARAPVRCTWFVAVETHHGTLSHTLESTSPVSDLLPAVARLARVHRHGLAVVAEVEHGASTGTAAVLVVTHGRLALVPAPPRTGFYYNGSVTHLNAVDCFRGPGSGRIVISGAWLPSSTAKRMAFERRIYALRESRLVLEKVIRRTTRPPGLPPRTPEFRGSMLFASCSVAANPRVD
jgi:hypothetical protein